MNTNGGGNSHHVTRQEPCGVCGKEDWCNKVTYPNGDIVFLCHRTDGQKGDTVPGADGNIYVCTGETSTGFTKWQEIGQYEAFIADYKAQHGYGNGKKSYHKTERRSTVTSFTDLPVEGVSKLASPARLDTVYRAFLDLLVLEEKHKKKLAMEWDKEVDGENVMNIILPSWPIKSVPPEDFLRYSSKEPLANMSRKAIMEKLIAEVGEPVGIPGFYQRKDGRWTFYRLCGIAYPCFNTHGQIVRIRIGDDYPTVDGELDGQEGVFRYQKDKETEAVGWYFIPCSADEKLDYGSAVLVWQYGSPQNRIELTKKGYPKGKVSGKYKNFSSFADKVEADENGRKHRVNIYTNGCQSGSSTSLYRKAGDDTSVIYITEGEKKAIVANAILHAPVISLPGVSSYNKVFEPEEGYDTSIMDELNKVGFEIAALIFDADKNENSMVLMNEKKAVKEFLNRNLPIAIGQWNENWGKGLDDVLLNGVKPRLAEIA